MATSILSLRYSTSISQSRQFSKPAQSCRRWIVCNQKSIEDRERECFDGKRQCWMNRRNAMAQFLVTSVSFPLFPLEGLAESENQENTFRIEVDEGDKSRISDPQEGDENFRIYLDDKNKFEISVPQGWLKGEGEPNGFKLVTAFFPQEKSNSNVTIAITGIGPDFTKLESFGKVDEFAESLVNGLDRSWKRPPGLAAKLINSKAANGLYYVDYTLQNPGEGLRYVYSAVGMGFNGWYNRLYTVTGQFMEEEAFKYGPKIQKAVASFRLTSVNLNRDKF